MSAPPASPSRPLDGLVLADRYELRALLGRGGMGEVYEAADRRLDRTVAVKVLREELARDRRFVARFHREARTAARLEHPAIVSVHDFGQDGERVYLVLEHVPGRTLHDLLRAEGPQAPAVAAALAAQVAEALGHAHARGIVHRDVAPGNVMVRTDGAVKVLDFGIARAVQGSGHGGSVTAHGTLAYAAPEVLAGEPADQRVDVYGLGAVLYELVTGRPPFEGDDVPARLRIARPELPSALDPAIPGGLDETVMQCLDRSPAARPSDAMLLAQELRRLAAYLPSERPTRPPTGPASTGGQPRTDRLPSGTPVTQSRSGTSRIATPVATEMLPAMPRTRRRGVRWLFLSGLTLAALAGVALLAPGLLRLGAPVVATVRAPASLPAPTALGAIASCDGFLSTGVDVSWTAVLGADGYEVWRRGVDGEAWERAVVLGADATSVRDADLGVDTAYVYRIRALDGPLPGRWSEARIVRTPLWCLS